MPLSNPPAVYCTLVRRNRGFEALITAELTHTHDAVYAEPGVYLSSSPVAWAETGYGVAGGRQLAAAATLEELSEQLRALKLAPKRFGIVAYRIPRTAKGSVAAKKAVADSIDGEAVDPASTVMPLGLLISPSGFRVFIRSDGGDSSWLRVEERPNNVPVAIGVRLAKAALNLTITKPGPFLVFDPFAGSGTIPLVAALSGHAAFGSDTAYRSVAMARENAKALGTTVEFYREDARTSTRRGDYIITNPPYGAFSHLVAGGIRDVLTNLRTLAPRVTFVTSEDLRDLLRANGYQLERTVEVEPERFKRFVFVTRAPLGSMAARTNVPS